MTIKFRLIEPAPLKSQGDGRRLALEVIRELRDAGKIHCSAHPEEQEGRQCGAFLTALVKLAREGTSQARTGFAVVITDLLGRALARTMVPEIFEERERRGVFTRLETGNRGRKAPGAPESSGTRQGLAALTVFQTHAMPTEGGPTEHRRG